MEWRYRKSTLRNELLRLDNVEGFVNDNDTWLGLRVVRYPHYRRVLANGGTPLMRYFQTTTGWVWVLIYAWRGHLYVFIPNDPKKEGVREDQDWHGLYFGRIT
jgi:hypothetical protein